MFQHRPFLELLAQHHHCEVISLGGVLASGKRIPGLGIVSAQVYSPEAAERGSWFASMAHADVGRLDILTQAQAPSSWRPEAPDDLRAFVVDLRGGEDAAYQRLERRAQKALRQAQRAGMTVRCSVDIQDLDMLLPLLHRVSEHGKRYQVPPRDLMAALLRMGFARLYLAHLGNVLVGGTVVAVHRYAHGLVSGYDVAAANGLPGTLMSWEMIRGEIAADLPFLDLGTQSPHLQPGLTMAKRALGPLEIATWRYERRAANLPGWVGSMWRGTRRMLLGG